MTFAAVTLLLIAPYTPVLFLGSSLSSALVYLWARRHHGLQLALFGLVNFTAPYLPWALLILGMAVGNDPLSDALGILVGHMLFFAEDVFPALAAARGWSVTALLPNPTNCTSCARAVCRRMRIGGGGAVVGREGGGERLPTAAGLAPPPPPPPLPAAAPIGFDNHQ